GAPVATAATAPASAAPVAQGAAPEAAKVDIITPHITDAHFIEVPCLSFAHGFACEVELPRWAPVHVGPVAIDLSPTKHVVMLLIVALLVCVVLITAARSQAAQARSGKPPRGFANGVEAMVLYLRNEVILPNVGHHGDAFVPYLLTLFFFILFANLLGLVPYMSTATGNIAVTATLAIITFFVIEIAGMKALGKGYINTIIYWPHDMPLAMRIPMSLILSPVELLGKFTKPFALTIRLFANMTAGHIVVLAFVGMIFTFQSYYVAPAPLAMAIAIMFLEMIVALIQAFIFTLLSSVFIGLVRESHH
ncbi:MAG: F0F1 ATP synthase subunit A, partial [Gemmatimonadetes bacterium]|nr:F0F1 ATP synthase subunit A [Gemmatimonadota bacterium]